MKLQNNAQQKARPNKYFKMRMSRAIEALSPEVYKEYMEMKKKFWANVKEDDRKVVRAVDIIMDQLDFTDDKKLNRLETADGNQITLKINQLASFRDRLGDIANEYATDANFIYRYWKNRYASEFTPAKIEAGRKARISDEKLYKEDIEGEVMGKIWQEQLLEIVIQEFANYLLTKLESIEIKINALKDRLKELWRQQNTPDHS
jgi:hypothetical protein